MHPPKPKRSGRRRAWASRPNRRPPAFSALRQWEYSAPLIAPEQRQRDPSRAAEGPDRGLLRRPVGHVFMTVKPPGRSAIEYCSFEKWEQANASPRTLLRVSASDYYCAPEVFYFRPHRKWYLIYQVGVHRTGQNVGGVFHHREPSRSSDLDARPSWCSMAARTIHAMSAASITG